MHRLTATILVALLVNSCIALAVEVKSDRPNLEATHKENFTPPGELCTKLAEDSGLLSRDYRKFMVDCLKKHEQPNPHKEKIAHCYTKNAGLKDKAWEDAVKSCFDKIDFKSKK